MNMNKALLIMTLLNTFQMTKMCLILKMRFHTVIITKWEGNYWLGGRGISLY